MQFLRYINHPPTYINTYGVAGLHKSFAYLRCRNTPCQEYYQVPGLDDNVGVPCLSGGRNSYAFLHLYMDAHIERGLNSQSYYST